jgi:hypothetical protein
MKRRSSAVLLSLGLLVWGCAGPALDARLDIAAAVNGSRITVSGSTNLPDGARIFVYVWHQDESLQVDSENLVPVVGGRYTVEVDLGGWPPGMAHATAAFLLDGYGPQPSHVLAAVGDFGERLGGPQVRDDEFGYRLVSSAVVDIPVPN